MQEKIHCFGQHQNLHGVFTQATTPTKSPCVLIINAGAVHKAGPFNLHVHLARHLAKQGVNSFRFDLSGQGDSLKVASPLSHEEQVLTDMRQALDYLAQEYQLQDFVSFGLCTGAENAHKIGVDDERIKGIIWIDGYGYLTPKYKRVKLIKKLSKPFALVKAIFNKLLPTKKVAVPQTVQADLNVVDNFVWRLPEKASYINDMNTLNTRQTQCLYVYSGGVQTYYNYLGQMTDALGDAPFTKLIEEAYFPRADHTFFVLGDKQALFERISTWLAEKFQAKQ